MTNETSPQRQPAGIKDTDVEKFIGELDGGQLQAMLSRFLSLTGASVSDHGKKGKVKIELDFTRVAGSKNSMVNVTSKISFIRPTTTGDQSEKSTAVTPMYVGPKGLTYMPDTQEKFEFKG